MALYRYEAVDRSGKAVLGAMNAPDEQHVAQRLSAMGYSLKAVYPTAGSAKAAAQAKPRAAAPLAGADTFPVSVEPCVSLGVLARFYRQLATMVRAGIPIFQALEKLSAATSNRRLREACDEVKEHVRGGEKLSGAMALHSNLFPVHTTGLIWAGELGGYLDVALDEAAAELEQEAKDRRFASIGYWIAKGNLASLILTIPALDLKALLVRGLSEAAKRAPGVASPDLIPSNITPQQILAGMAAGYWGSFKTVCIPLFVAWIVLAFAWRRLKRTPKVRKFLDAALLLIPMWGNYHRERARERFLKSLQRLYQSAVPPGQAWPAASMTVRNSEIVYRLKSCEQLIRSSGGTLQQAFVQSGAFPLDDAGMVGTGEASGSVPEVLERLSSYHADGVSGSKSRGRMMSIHAVILACMIPAAYVDIRVTQAYFSIVLDAGKLLGLE